MFFERISKECKELGAEIISFYEQINVTTQLLYDNNRITTYSFRGVKIMEVSNKGATTLFGGAALLNNKETKYMHDCVTKGQMKKITFTENK